MVDTRGDVRTSRRRDEEAPSSSERGVVVAVSGRRSMGAHSWIAGGARAACFAMLVVLAGCVTATVTTISTFASPDGHFSVVVPGGTMTESTLPTGGAFAAAPAHTFATTTADGTRLAVIYADADPSYLASTPIAQALDAAEQGNVASTKGSVVRHGSIAVTGIQGREQRIDAGGLIYEFRIVFVGNRLYSVSATGSGVSVGGALEVQFLNSFVARP